MGLKRSPTPVPAVRVLLEETDPDARVEAHLLLGQQAAARNDLVAAEAHYREAVALDPHGERPRRLLGGLQRATARPDRPGRLWSLFRKSS